MTRTLLLGTRGSLLARTQSQWVAEQIQTAHPGVSVELKIIQTMGDQDQSAWPASAGRKGLFTHELDRDVLSGEVHIAVHSLKDLPAEIAPGLEILAVPTREHPGDALISRQGVPFSELTAGSSIGTGSLRRRAQLRHIRSDVVFADLRGNVDTRLSKLERGEFDAIVLAVAGLRRLGLAGRITEILDFGIMLPAAGQGALAITGRADDSRTRRLIERISDADTVRAVTAERSVLAILEGGCDVPIAALGRVENDDLKLEAMVATPDGSLVLRRQCSGPAASSGEVGRRLADQLLRAGAREILEAAG